MARELQISLDPSTRSGLPVTAKVINAGTGTTVAASVACAEQSGNGGWYVGDMPAAAAGIYLVLFFANGLFLGAGFIFWDGAAEITVATIQNSIPTAAANATAVRSELTAELAEVTAIKAKTDNLPASPASTTNITAATGIMLAAATHTGAVIPTVTNLTNAPTAGDLTAMMKASVTTAATAATPTAAAVTAAVTLPSIPAGWITAAGIAANALAGKGDWSTYAGGDTSGVTTLLSRSAPLDAAGIRAAVGLASANLDMQLGTVAQAAQIPANFTAGLFASAGVFSVGALANAPTGGGTAPTAAQIRAEMDGNSTRLASIVGTLGVAGAGLTALGDARLAYLDANVSDAAAAGNPWLAPIQINDAGDTVAAGALQARLFVSDAMPPVIVVPAPPADPDKCTVYIDTEKLTGTRLAGLRMTIDTSTKPVRATRALLGPDFALSDATGRIEVALPKTTTLTPSTARYVFTIAELNFCVTTDLTGSTFDLGTLI